MKTLVESIFDDDLVEKNPDLYSLKRDFMFDGQLISRSRVVAVDGEFSHKPNYLGAIDWKLLKKKLADLKAIDYDLGKYPYYNSGPSYMRTRDSVEKTEMVARYILNMPLKNKLMKSSYNSWVRDEMEDKLNVFIDNLNLYKFDVFISENLYYIQVRLLANNANSNRSEEVIRWDFAYLQ
jgi:hypothetical protein